MVEGAEEDGGQFSNRKPAVFGLAALGIGVSLYLSISILRWLVPSGVFGGIFLLCFGLFLGLAAFPLILVLLFVLTTHKGNLDIVRNSEHKPDFEELRPKELSSGHFDDLQRRQQEYDDVVKEMLEGSSKAKPPHRFYNKGLYSGWVWTIPASEYEKSEAIINWPPATEGPKKVATRWWGSLRGQTLYLARSSNLQENYQVPVLEVNLADCRVEIVRNALKSKSQWWRKCPLEISHTSRDVLHSERAFEFFAEGSASKEQWYLALKNATGQNLSVESLKESYLEFCTNLRGNEDLYPQEDQTNSLRGKSPSFRKRSESPKKAPAKSQSRTWGRMFSRKRKTLQLEAEDKKSVNSSRSSSPLKKPDFPPGYLSPMELDSAWMGKGAVPKNIAVPANQEGIDSGDLDGEDGENKGQSLSVNLDEIDRSSHSLPSTDEARKAAPIVKASKSVHFPVSENEPKSPFSPSTSDASGNPPINFTEESSEKRNASQIPETPRAETSNLFPIEDAINMLLVRGAFDILRSPAVNTMLKAHIHKKLNELRFPSWLHGIEVHEIDTGNTVPTIHNLRAMPSPSASIWPQVIFDFEYEGDITVVIETKLDVRDGEAWSRLGKAIHQIEGGQAPGHSDDDTGSDSETERPRAASPEPVNEASKKKKGLLANILPLRQAVAQGIRQVAEVAADHVAKMQLKLRLDIKSLKGPIYAWIPPPPGDRLWFAFVTPPKLVAAATPLVGGRLLKYSYQAGRVSQWVGSKMQSSIAKNMVFPSCSDIPIRVLLGVDHPEMAFIPSSFPSGGEKSNVSEDASGTSILPGKEGTKNEGLPDNELEKAASLENQTVIDTSAVSNTSKLAKIPKTLEKSQKEGKIANDPGMLSSDKASPSNAKSPEKLPAKTGFWARRKSKKILTPDKAPQDVELKEKAAEKPSFAESQIGNPILNSAKDTDETSQPLQEGVKNYKEVPDQEERSLAGHDLSHSHISNLPGSGHRVSTKQNTDNVSKIENSEKLVGSRVSSARNSQKPNDSEKKGSTQEPTSQAQKQITQTPHKNGLDLSDRDPEPESQNKISSSQDEDIEQNEGGNVSKSKASGGHSESNSTEADVQVSEFIGEDLPEDAGKDTSKENAKEEEPLKDPLGAVILSGLKLGAKPEAKTNQKQSLTSEDTPVESQFKPKSNIDTARQTEFLGSLKALKIAEPAEDTTADAEEVSSPQEHAEIGQPDSGSPPRSSGWGSRWNVTGSKVQSQWEAFKNRNPNTVQQGIKLAGTVEKWKEQAQEQYRKAQEAKRKQQELKQGKSS